MTEEELILRLIQSHRSLEHFDYSIAVDWAIDLIRQGKETDNILMLASFSAPIDRLEIRPYVTYVVKDLGLEELDYQSAVIVKAHFHLTEILNNKAVRKNLQSLYQLCLDKDYESRLMNFYLIYHAWYELEEIGVNYYFQGADLNNIEDVIKSEAMKWIAMYIDGRGGRTAEKSVNEEDKTLPPAIYKSNGGDSTKLNKSTKNKNRSWWRRLW
jgi:hypothetical protein